MCSGLRPSWTKDVRVLQHNVTSDRPCRSGDATYADVLHAVWAVKEKLRRPIRQEENDMIGPAKNRLHDYEAGWLTLLIRMGVASQEEARAAMKRVARAAIDEQEARRERRGNQRRRKGPPE